MAEMIEVGLADARAIRRRSILTPEAFVSSGIYRGVVGVAVPRAISLQYIKTEYAAPRGS